MSISFPFRKEKSPVFGNIHRPVAEVFFKEKLYNLWQPVTLIVDTGADYTLLPLFLAEELSIDVVKDCQTITTQGVGGASKAYLLKNKIEARIGDLRRQIPLGFLDNDYIPPLLGRQEFLETFRVVFEKFHVTFTWDKEGEVGRRSGVVKIFLVIPMKMGIYTNNFLDSRWSLPRIYYGAGMTLVTPERLLDS